jgi:hypothetical protein
LNLLLDGVCHNPLLVRAVCFLIIVIIIAGSNYDLLAVPLLPFFATFGTSLSAFGGSFRPCPLTAADDHFPIALDEDNPNHLFT